MADGRRFKKNAEKLENRDNLRIIKRNRKTRGGGVAIIFNKSKMSLREVKIRNNQFELVGALGRTSEEAAKILVLSVYYPPQMKKDKVDALNSCITDTIDRVKIDHAGIKVVLCGDMNRKDVIQIAVDHPDMTILDTPHTRKLDTIDLCFTNIAGEKLVKKLPPLSSSTGQMSDHNCILVGIRSEKRHCFEKIKFKHRPFSEKKAEAFGRDLAAVDWAEIHCLPVDEAVDFMNHRFQEIYRKNFPEETKWIKSSDPPWFTKRARRATEKKRKCFRRRGKGTAWRRVCQDTEKIIAQAKKDFISKVKKGFLETKNSRSWFKAIKSLKTKEVEKPWNVRSLFPETSDEEIANKCADFFCEISSEYRPLGPPKGGVPGAWVIPMHEISSRLRYCKKPKGIIDGDLPPALVTKFSDLIAIPLAHIFNRIIEDCVWPTKWKLERVKIIPKGSIPESVKDVRNISCTPLFSKVMEFFVLSRLRSCMKLSNAQFGGIKGVSIDHFLIETWHEVLMSLEEGNAAANLLSVDFSKAFNRMDHHACLSALEEAGVDSATLGVVHAFLYDRKMQVHVHDSVSSIRSMPGGAPQGSVLGSYLFCATTDKLSRIDDNNRSLNFSGNGRNVTSGSESDQETEQPLSPIARPQGTEAMWDVLGSSDTDSDEDIQLGIRHTNQRLLDTTVESVRASQSAVESFLGTQHWERAPPTVKAYIDDFNVIEKVRTDGALCHVTQNRTKYQVHAPESQSAFACVKGKSAEIGMIVNDAKTQMLCISSKGKDLTSYINVPDSKKIESSEKLKILGFTFGPTPDVSLNTELLVSSFNRKMWGLRYLKGAGMEEDDLLGSYKAVVRPTLEFAACSYHSLLTLEQDATLESLQRRAMKIIFGENVSYRTVIDSGRVDLLHDRREGLFKKFAIKASKSQRFATWFPQNREIDHNLRRREKYHIPHLRTERARKSPIICMRRLLNEME